MWWVLILTTIVLVMGCVTLISYKPTRHHHAVRLGTWGYHGIQRWLLTRGHTRINPNLCEDMLRQLKYICDIKGVVFWLSEGTALGAIRENRILPDDSDVDICMDVRYWRTFHDEVIPILQKQGFVVIRDIKGIPLTTLTYRGQYLDVNAIVPDSGCMCVPGPCNDVIPYLKPLRQVKLGSDTYWAPPDSFLEFLYGPTWRTPRTRFKPLDARSEMSSSK